MKKLLYRVQRRAVSSVLALSMAFGVCYEAFPKTKQNSTVNNNNSFFISNADKYFVQI